MNNKNNVNLSLNKFPLIGGNFDKFLLSRLNKTFNETRIKSLNNTSLHKIKKENLNNTSLHKIKKENLKEDNADKNNKNVLL